MVPRSVACILALFFIQLSPAQRVGDAWTTTRGDETPNLRYSAATTTSSGRIIAVGNGGNLMYSDNGGDDWKFDRIEINGTPVSGTFTDLYQVPNGSLIAVMVRLEETPDVGYFAYHVRTYFLTSSNNGDSWTMTPFPRTFATWGTGGRMFHGVNITGLYTAPSGELIAYGTTSGTNHPGAILWSIGGVIFRQAGGSWEQAHFGYGPVGKVTDAEGRAVAVAHNAIMDSADGAGWNGYEMRFANVELNGGPLDPEDRQRLRAIDVEVLDGGTYVAQGATFVPYKEGSNIDTNIIEQAFKMSSSTPFSGARNWTAYSEPYRGTWTKIGNNIVAASAGGAYTTSSGGPGFSLAEAEVRTWADTIAPTSSNNAFAVESSETVWSTASGGSSWSKIWDKDLGPDLRLLGYFEGTLFARSTDFSGALWISRDNGKSWQPGSADFKGHGPILKSDGGRLITPAGGTNIQISGDGGATWTTHAIAANNVNAFLMTQTGTGRLVVPTEGRDINNEGKFYVSDDGGETWAPKTAGLQWGEDVRSIVTAESGRIIAATNRGIAGFWPRLYYSDDDGETWTLTDILEYTEGLDEIDNEPGHFVIQITKMIASPTGRVIALGDDEIITSDDGGESWTVRVNLGEASEQSLHEDIRDIIRVGSRWIAVGSYRTPYPQSRNKHFLLVSDNDGATWGMRPFETNQPNTFLHSLAQTDDGRLVLAGGNASIFVSDPEPLPAVNPVIHIREGAVQTVPVARPDVDGAIEAAFSAVQRTAIGDVDYVPTAGVLNWAADDDTEKLVTIETIDNNKVDNERHLLLRLDFETEEGLAGASETPVQIVDDDASNAAGLVFEGLNSLYTSEAGDSAELGVALETKPTADVVVSISGAPPTEGTLSSSSLTFTQENWNAMQYLTITGVDDSFPDGDRSYDLEFAIASDDTAYAGLPVTKALVINLGDEPYQAGGENISEELVALIKHPLAIASDGTVSFRLPADISGIAIGSEVSVDLKDWEPGPAPVAGETIDGMTTYTLALPAPATARFARITFQTRVE